MTLQELLTENIETPSIEYWNNKSTASVLRALAVRLHSTGISLRETTAALESFGVSRSHQAVFQSYIASVRGLPTRRQQSRRRVGVDETAIRVGREQCWVYAAIDVDSKLLLDVRVSHWRATRPASAFLAEPKEQHDLSGTEFLVDGMGYLSALAQNDLGGHLDHVTRNLIEKWFQTLTMRIARVHETWMDGRASVLVPKRSFAS